MVRKGERYRCKAPLEVIAMTSWAAPFTGGADKVLPAGEEFVVASDPPVGATAVCCNPVRYDELHAHFVSAKDRRNKRYSGYYLCIDIGLIDEQCESMGGSVGSIAYIMGDATCPQAKGVKIICHICNDIGGWGKGFVLALSKRWEEPEASYRKWHAAGRGGGFVLGAVQFVQVEPYIWVANMVAQRGIKRGSSVPPVRYEAVASCLAKVAAKAIALGASVHMPRIGCGLAGGKWSEVGSLIDQHLISEGVPVTVYDFE